MFIRRPLLFLYCLMLWPAFAAADPQSDLYVAVRANDHASITSAVSAGADLNPECGTHSVCKLLAVAAEASSAETVRLLLELGADPNGKSAYGNTPLIYALMRDRKEIVRSLVEKGADVNLPNSFGVSPFIGVCGSGKVELVTFFLEKGADVDASFANRTTAATPHNVTALMRASENGRKEVVSLLLKKGANVAARDSEGKTAIDYAQKKNHSDIVSLLREAN